MVYTTENQTFNTNIFSYRYRNGIQFGRKENLIPSTFLITQIFKLRLLGNYNVILPSLNAACFNVAYANNIGYMF